MSEVTIGKCVVDKDGNIVELVREFYGHGDIFKDWDAYEHRPKDPCYVPELEDVAYTHEDFLSIAEGDEEIAEHLFYFVDWESPESALDMDLREEEIIRCESCGKLIWSKMEEVEACPHCGANPYEPVQVFQEPEGSIPSEEDEKKQGVPRIIDMNALKEYDQVKDKITARLVMGNGNEEYLKDKPHRAVADMVVTYHVIADVGEKGTASVAITDWLMKQYGVDEETLYEVALSNMEKRSPAVFRSMSETMIYLEMISMGMNDKEAKKAVREMMPPITEDGLFVLTTKDKLYGASAVLLPSVMDGVAEKVGKDFFILPSSVHEVLVVAQTDGADLKALEKMVRDVNAAEVKPEDQLSDHVYAYDYRKHMIYRADKKTDIDERTQEELADLWDSFGDVPIDDDDRILEVFLDFDVGTNRFEVWKWFDERFPGGVRSLVHKEES